MLGTYYIQKKAAEQAQVKEAPKAVEIKEEAKAPVKKNTTTTKK